MAKERNMKTEGGIPETTDLARYSTPEPETEPSLESLQVQVDKNRADIAHLMTRTGTPRPRTQAEVDTIVKEAKAEAALSAEQKDERVIRRYVRRTGGYRKGVTPAEKALAGRLLKKLGRDSKVVTNDDDVVIGPAWDTRLLP